MDFLPCIPMFSLWFSLWCVYVATPHSSPPFVPSFETAGVAATALASETDRFSLLDLKGGITGDPTGALWSWNHSLHYCQWRGITCGRRHHVRVTGVNLTSLRLSGYISPSITNLTFLRLIDLSYNQLYGIIPPQLGALRRLEYLNLSYNSLGGAIPSNLTSCLELKAISLSDNQLVGEIPMALGNLRKLAHLSAAYNKLTGAIPPALGNLSSNLFQFLELHGNELTGGIPAVLGHLSNLQVLGVMGNKLSGTVPPSLYNLSNMVMFILSINQFSGTLPSDLGTTLPKLTHLAISVNRFEGSIPRSLPNASSLQKIMLLGNNLRGTIPDNLGLLKELEFFTPAFNALETRKPDDWNFLTSLTNCTHLRVLSVAYNDLGGALPNSIANLTARLESLTMGGNQISGSIPMGIENLRGLLTLGMSRNQLTGSIPSSLGKLQNLGLLNLSHNALSGEIPLDLGNLTHLSELYLEYNNLSGRIPTSFSQYRWLENLKISNNLVDGSIPDELFTIFTLADLDLSNNSLEGSLPSKIGHLINLRYLDLSVNRLSGNLPNTLGDCQSMEQLYLYGNSFEGTIPSSLRNMKGIEVLDISLNSLTGEIPKFLEGLIFLHYLNLSFNNLFGEVPKNGVFANTSEISLLGNKRICGGILTLQLPPCPSQVEKKTKAYHSVKTIISIATAGSCLLLLLCLVTFLYLKRKSKEKTSIGPSYESKHKKISYHDLLKATNGFAQSNLIGTGSFASVYKGILDGETIVAVKVLNIQRRGASRSFNAECEVLRNIRHRNLIKIISICSSIDSSGQDFKALVFDFLPNGSLEKWLHPEPEVDTRALDFAQRLCIAADVTSALDYLHNHCQSPIVHCDLKPSNVLLDCNMTAYVGDFGLARFLVRTSSEDHGNHGSTIGIKGSIGYTAPEYGLGSPVSVSGDVYSFGILLLELFTARRPIDNMFKEGLCLQKFVTMALPDQALNVIDPRLIPEAIPVQNAHSFSGPSGERTMECFVSLMRIGLNCTKESPRERMSMGAVLKEIHQIQEAYLGTVRSIPS